MHIETDPEALKLYESMDRQWVDIGLVGLNPAGYDAQILKGINQFRESRPNWVLRDAGHQEYLLKTLLRNPNLRGVIANVTDHKRMEQLQAWGGPVIDLTGQLPDSPFPQLSSIPGSIGKTGARFLHEKGLKRILYVSGMNWNFEIDRWQGVREYCQENKIPAWWWLWSENKCMDAVNADPLPVFHDSSPFSAFHFLTQIEKPFGAFMAMDRMGVQLCDGCRYHDLKIPEDVAILGVDNNTYFCESCTPPLSSVIVPGIEIGLRAGELLQEMIQGHEVPKFTRLEPVGVKERGSTP
jgi:LacI family transcriptional regulator